MADGNGRSPLVPMTDTEYSLSVTVARKDTIDGNERLMTAWSREAESNHTTS